MTAYIALLRRNPNYARLWIAQVISLLGDWFNVVTLLALVSKFSNGSGLATSGLLIAHFLPPFLVSPFAGVLVDRFNRKHLLIASDLLRALLGFVLLFVLSPDSLGLIYLLTILQSMLAAIFEPGRSAILPSLVEPQDLLQANTLGSVTWSVMLAVGAVVGGVVATLFGPERALVIDALSFALSAVFIIQIKMPQKFNVETVASLKQKAQRGGFREGLHYIRQNPAVAATLFVKFGLSLGSVDALMVAYATTLFVIGENGTGSLGILYSAFGLGAIIGPLLFNRINNGSIFTLRRLIIYNFAFATVGWFLFGLAPSLLIVSLALMVRAMGGSVTWTYSSLLIQLSVPDEYLGRVFSMDWAGFYLAITVSTLVTGLLVDTLGKANAPLVALGTATLSIIPLTIWAGAVRWLEKQPAAASQTA